MRYQFVLQWLESSIDCYDDLIEIEDILIDKLSPTHEVDGHDVGEGELNIFVITIDVDSCYEEVKNILQDESMFQSVRIAYRELGSNDYVVLWPDGLLKFQVT